MRATAAAISEDETLRADSKVDSLLSNAEIETKPTAEESEPLVLADMPEVEDVENVCGCGW